MEDLTKIPSKEVKKVLEVLGGHGVTREQLELLQNNDGFAQTIAEVMQRNYNICMKISENPSP